MLISQQYGEVRYRLRWAQAQAQARQSKSRRNSFDVETTIQDSSSQTEKNLLRAFDYVEFIFGLILGLFVGLVSRYLDQHIIEYRMSEQDQPRQLIRD